MSDGASSRAHFRRRWYILTLLLIGLFAILPLVLTLVGAGIASNYGCSVNEGNVNPCVIDGTDWGETLAFFGISFWYLLATVPLGCLLFVIWLIVLVIHRVRWNKRQSGVSVTP